MKVRLTKLTVLIFLFSSVSALAQNKTLAVGTPAPNANAALHVESPTGNQGFIMPRLTSAQRTAMAGLLAAADQGLMLFDTDLKTIFIWDGAAWKSTAEVAGGTKLAYPYKDSVTVATGTTDVFALKYNAPQNARVLRVENLRTDNGSSAVSVLNNGTGLAGYFQVNNPTSGSSAIYGTTNSNLGGAVAPVGVYGESSGTGSLGGAFWNTNAANNFPALYTRTQGTGSSATFEIVNPANTSPVLVLNTDGTGNALQTAGRIQAGQFVGDGSLLTNIVSSPVTFPFTTSQSDASALFRITNTGAGDGVVGENTGTGYGLHGMASGTTFGNAAVYGQQTGTGDAAGVFEITNPASNQPALWAETDGIGSSVYAKHTGSSGRAGWFEVDNATNTSPSILGLNDGLGVGVHVILSNAANASAGVLSITSGTGNGGRFAVTNPASTAYGVLGETNGAALSAGVYGHNTGGGFGVLGRANGTAFGSAAVYGEQLGTGDAAGAFRISNTGSTFAALYGETNGTSAAGSAVRGLNTGGGNGAYFRKNGADPSTAALWADNFGTAGYGAIIQNIDATNTQAALYVEAVGTGPSVLANKAPGETGHSIHGRQAGSSGHAALFETTDPANASPTVQVFTASATSAIDVVNTGSSDGFAGSFYSTDAANTYPAIQAGTQGSGTGVRVIQDATSLGGGMDVMIQNPSSTAVGFNVNQQGQGDGIISNVSGSGAAIVGTSQAEGRAAYFNNSNGGSTGPVVTMDNQGSGSSLEVFNNGTGHGIFTRAVGTTDALLAVKDPGDGVGSAGNFQNNEPSNGASTLFAMTNAEPGTAIGAINSAEGNALKIFTGGFSVSTTTLDATVNTVISTRATAYLITDASSPFTFSGGITLNEGDVFYFVNNGGANADVEGVIIPAGQGAILIYIAGALRAIYGTTGS